MNTNINSGKPNIPMYMIAILVTLAVGLIVSAILIYQKTNELNSAYESINYVENQKQKLEGELNELIVGYDSLKTENDSVNIVLEGEQVKIRKLLRIQASNSTKIKLYQKELGTLRQIMRSYIVQIDSLNTSNRELTAENVEVRTQLRTAETDIQELSDTKEQLSSTVALAQQLTAKNTLAVGLDKRSKEKDRVSKVEKIKVCFTVRENSVAKAGKKMIYVQITRPDNIILSSDEAGIFTYQEEKMIYSSKRELEYDNQDIDMCIFWDHIEELIAGTYSVSLYCEDYNMGTTELLLK
jgi:chromosome segregation ATPase